MSNKDPKKRIEKIIQDRSMNVNSQNLKQYLDFIKKNIPLPHKVTGIQNDFTYSDYKDKTPAGNSVFEIIGYEENIDDFSNIFAKVKYLNSEAQIFSLQLFEFKSIESHSKESRILEDYSYWIENYL